MPDLNLRQAVRETLELPDGIPLTQATMLRLTGFNADSRGVRDLTGLEHAMHLTWLNLGGNEIQDLSPLAGLTRLKGLWIYRNPISDISPLETLANLETLDVGACQLSDIRPLEKLTRLESLRLHVNSIRDIGPLVKLKRLRELWLQYNSIVDITPLAGLTDLQELRIEGNPITDWTLLDQLKIEKLTFDEICQFPKLSIRERLENRSFPSTFQAWQPTFSFPELPLETREAYHDLIWSPRFRLQPREIDGRIELVGPCLGVEQERAVRIDQNPNMIFIMNILMRDAPIDEYPDDWPYWLRDAAGNRVYEDKWKRYLIDFTMPGAQDWIVENVLAAARTGLYDGIVLDWWKWWFDEDLPMLSSPPNVYRTLEAEHAAKDAILRQIREAVGDDFLILVNPNRHKVPEHAAYINGLFIETLPDSEGGNTHDGLFIETLPDFEGSYSYEGLAQIENTLLWAEENLREPQVNCVEGWGVFSEPADSPINQKWMRVITTMVLTHSDGYVLYNTGSPIAFQEHNHLWYDFWDAPLGHPVGEKARLYKNREGLFIREFTNGWAVYNRSGKAQKIQLPEKVSGVTSGITDTEHTLPDFDGEIYLKATVEITNFADVNGDGVVNVLDLVLVAQHLGESVPPNSEVDVNGDGIVNILDLTLIAQHLGGGTAAAAPAIVSDTLNAAVIQAWIEQVQLENDGTIAFQHAIAKLQELLESLIPEKTALLANYPNPFNPETWIPYQLDEPAADVILIIYAVDGTLIRTLALGHQSAGIYHSKSRAAYWDGRNDVGEPVASGVYFYTFTAGDFTATRKMLIRK